MTETLPKLDPPPGLKNRAPLRALRPMPGDHAVPAFGGMKNALPNLRPLGKRVGRRQTAPSFGKIEPVKPISEDVKEIPTLISNCTFNFGKTFAPCDGKEIVSPYDTKEVGESLSSLERILNRDGVFDLVTPETSRLILETMSRGLFRKCSDIPKKYIFCDQRVTLTVVERNIYLSMYRILAKTVRHVDLQKIQEWATPRVLRSLVECWETPDDAEDMGIELVIGSVCDRIPETKRKFYDIVIEKIEDEEAKHSLLISALRWLAGIHTRDLSIPPELEVFKKAVMPLFRSPYLPMFMKQLDQLSGAFYGYFEELPEAVAEYMFRHWPMTDSNKGSCYMNHVKTLVGAMGTEAVGRISLPLFGEVLKYVNSLNTHLVESVLGVLADRGVMSMLRDTWATMIRNVVEVIEARMSTWEGNLLANAALALETIRGVWPEFEERVEPEKKVAENVGEEWMALAEEVARDHPEFDKEKFAVDVNSSIC